MNIPCKLMKQYSGQSDFLSMHDASVCDIGGALASTITARYYKGIGNHKDNMVMVYESKDIDSFGAEIKPKKNCL